MDNRDQTKKEDGAAGEQKNAPGAQGQEAAGAIASSTGFFQRATERQTKRREEGQRPSRGGVDTSPGGIATRELGGTAASGFQGGAQRQGSNVSEGAPTIDRNGWNQGNDGESMGRNDDRDRWRSSPQQGQQGQQGQQRQHGRGYDVGYGGQRMNEGSDRESRGDDNNDRVAQGGYGPSMYTGSGNGPGFERAQGGYGQQSSRGEEGGGYGRRQQGNQGGYGQGASRDEESHYGRGQQSQTGHGQGGSYRSDENNYGRGQPTYRSDENNYGRSQHPAQGNQDQGRGNEGSFGAQSRRDEDDR